MLKVRARGATDIGKVRSVNQDSYYLADDHTLFIVADGMGGHAGGEIASRVCIEEIRSYLLQHIDLAMNDEVQIQHVLADAINAASTRIYEYALENPELKGMGTTATVLFCAHQCGYIGHVGDSRLYILRSGFIYQVSDDHSLVSEQLKAGKITEEEAKNHRLKNIITRSVGYQEREYVDTKAIELVPGDFLILCSDGLHGKVSEKELVAMVSHDDVDCVNDLIDLANERGGEDNITVVVVKIEEL